MCRSRIITHNYYNSSTKPKFYKNTRLVNKIIEKTSLTFFFFFKQNFIKQNTQVHRECTWIGVYQVRKLQWSSITKRLEQEKEVKTELQSNKEWRRRDLISRIDHSFPSKHLVFLSKLHGLRYEYKGTAFLEKLGYDTFGVWLLINYSIFIFMYNLNIFRQFMFIRFKNYVTTKKKNAWKHI